MASAVSSVLAAQYCNAATSVCYYEVVASGAAYRIAIPDAAAAPFVILLHIAAPKTVGWAGVAWGGQMALNPPTLGWANGNGAVVSSWWAT